MWQNKRLAEVLQGGLHSGGKMTEAIKKINLAEKFGLFQEPWNPRIIAELNDSFVKLVRLQGEFVWHHHDVEDELFLVVQGELTIQLRDGDLHLGPGELVVIPKGIEHKPVANGEVQALLLELKSTRNTGNVQNERTVDAQWI
jgi:mannose-6-phosphate isomerase-like protein (cupin superfamily)